MVIEKRSTVFVVWVRGVLLAALFASLTPAQGQTSSGSATTTAIPRVTPQGPADTSLASTSVRDSLGRLCFDVEAVARSHAVDQEMYDHVVSIKNNCPRTLKLRACYYNSDRCNQVSLQPYQRVDSILGTMRNIRFFRYVVR